MWSQAGMDGVSDCCMRRLLPKEPLKRAHVRFAIEYFSSKINTEFYKYVINQSAENARENFETNINTALIRVSGCITSDERLLWFTDTSIGLV